MGHYEDRFFEIYEDIKVKNLREDFDKQLVKMSRQEKHRFKSQKERWEYAHARVTGSI